MRSGLTKRKGPYPLPHFGNINPTQRSRKLPRRTIQRARHSIPKRQTLRHDLAEQLDHLVVMLPRAGCPGKRSIGHGVACQSDKIFGNQTCTRLGNLQSADS